MTSIILFLMGLIFGSFVGALSWRIPKGISIAKGRSICPNCKHQIAWYDNIPVLSYIILGGRCRNCKKRISIRYPLIELTSGLGFFLIYYFFTLKGVTLQGVDSIFQLVLTLALFVILLAIFVIDWEHQIIPDSLVFSGFFVVMLYLAIFSPQSIIPSLFSGFIAATFLLLIHLLTRGRGMGLGDVKFAILGGMAVGLRLLPVWLFLSFLTGAFAGCILILSGKAKMKTKIAFGPFLVIGLVLAYVFGDRLITYLGLI